MSRYSKNKCPFTKKIYNCFNSIEKIVNLSNQSNNKRFFVLDINKIRKEQKKENKVWKFLKRIFILLIKLIFFIGVIFVISYLSTIFLDCAIQSIKESKYNYKFWRFVTITMIYHFFMLWVKGMFVRKCLFKDKKRIMKIYYETISGDREYSKKLKDLKDETIERINKKNDTITSNNRELILTTNNGAKIGIIEGYLFAIGIFIQSITFIGVVLAVRSYVSVSSHQNKEEGEFYIIGVLGSLLFTIVVTSIYILSCDYFSNVPILNIISKYLPTFKGEITNL